MIEEELYINGNYIELSKDTRIGLTYQSNDVGDIGNGKGNYSNIFKVPKTRNNQIVLEVTSNPNSSSSLPYTNNDAKYLQNGVNLTPKGKATILSFASYYEIKIVGGNVNPFELMKDKLINELAIEGDNTPFLFTDNYFDAGKVGFIGVGVTTFSIGNSIKIQQDPGYTNASYNTATIITNILPNAGNNIIITDIDWALPTPAEGGNIVLFDSLTEVEWSLSNVVATNDRTEGVLFPVINYNGMSSAVREVDVRRLKPAVFAKTILDNIFNSIGFTYSGTFTANGDFERLILPMHTDDTSIDITTRVEGNAPKTLNFLADGRGFPYFLFGQDVGVLNDKVNDVNNSWQYLSGLSINYNHTTNQKGWQFVVENSSVHSFELSLPYTSTGTGSMFVSLAYKKSTSELGDPYNKLWPLPKIIAAPELGKVQVALGSSGTIDIVADTLPQKGDSIIVTVWGDVGGSVTFDTGSYLEITRQEVAGQVSFNDFFPIALNLPSIKQTDFVKVIAQLYGLAYQTNDYTKNVQFYSFGDIAKNKAIAIDWSNKLDLSKEVKVEYTIGNYAQSNVFSYKQDESVNNNTLRYSGNLVVNNEALPLTKNLVELPFSETVMEQKLNGLNVPYINQYDVISDTFALSANARLLYLDRQTLGVGINYIDGVNSPDLQTDDIPLCYFNLPGMANLGFSDNILESHYSELQDTLINVKKVTGHFRLVAPDISKLDFSIPIFLTIQGQKININGYFYLNIVSNYLPNKPTLCELVKL